MTRATSHSCTASHAACLGRAADGRSGTRKTMIVALARKLLIALWRVATTGEIPEGVILRVA